MKKQAAGSSQQAAGSWQRAAGSTHKRPLSRRMGRAGGFTLAELLVTITVISILASIVLGALGKARNTARVSKTNALIIKLDDIVMAQYESYRTRRVPIDTSGMGPKAAARRRLRALRQLMRLEMPERETDIVYDAPADPGWLSPDPNDPVPVPGTTVTMRRPALSQAYLRRYNASPNSNDYMSAEYLYLIVTLGTPDARGRFGESEVGDVDGDGWPEFIDGWGNPIAFLRWAPAFTDSEFQASIIPPERLEEGTDWGDPQSWHDDPKIQDRLDEFSENDHDPFDAHKVHRRAWRLRPLIYSAGPDGIYDINRDPNFVFQGNPYCRLTPPADPDPNLSGLPIDSDKNISVTMPLDSPNGSLDHYDNIHNHRLEVK